MLKILIHRNSKNTLVKLPQPLSGRQWVSTVTWHTWKPCHYSCPPALWLGALYKGANQFVFAFLTWIMTMFQKFHAWTHWSLMTLWPAWCQAITWTHADLQSSGWMDLTIILIKIYKDIQENASETLYILPLLRVLSLTSFTTSCDPSLLSTQPAGSGTRWTPGGNASGHGKSTGLWKCI